MAQGLPSHRTSFSRYTSSSSNYCTIFQEKQEARRKKGLQLRPSQTIASYRAGADVVGTRQRRGGVPEGRGGARCSIGGIGLPKGLFHLNVQEDQVDGVVCQRGDGVRGERPS
jgi:hypothetical protein